LHPKKHPPPAKQKTQLNKNKEKNTKPNTPNQTGNLQVDLVCVGWKPGRESETRKNAFREKNWGEGNRVLVGKKHQKKKTGQANVIGMGPIIKNGRKDSTPEFAYGPRDRGKGGIEKSMSERVIKLGGGVKAT